MPNPQNHITLSRSSLKRSMQCLKALYLHKHHNHLKGERPKRQQAFFDRSNKTLTLAHQLFPQGKSCFPLKSNLETHPLQLTEELIIAKHPVIYDATFQFEGISTNFNILVNKSDQWVAYEVKNSLKINRNHLQDIALKYYVAKNNGIQLEDIFIVHINGHFSLKNNELDIDKFFKITSIKTEVLELQDEIKEAINTAKNVLMQDKILDIEVDTHCFRPYACDFLNYCWKGKEKSALLSLSGVGLEEKIKWLKNNILEHKDIPQDTILSQRARTQIISHTEQRVFINEEQFTQFMEKLQYPLYFFDIEAFQPAIPIYNNNSPYQSIPFLFSLHYVSRPDDTPQLKQYITPPEKDGREDFLKSFINATEGAGQILVFNAHLEKGALYDLGKRYPQYIVEIKDRIRRIVDIEVIFKQNWFYHYKMNGSYSLKGILPALVDDISYQELNLSNGMNAMIAYQELLDENFEADKQKVLQDLLAYCEMDTYGLYLVFKKLEAYHLKNIAS